MMPDELSRYIQEFAKPRTNPQWRKGSLFCQKTQFGELYWELFDGPWYDFYNTEPIMISFFSHGMYHLSISYMLRTLFYHRGIDLTVLIYKHVKQNPYLSGELWEEMLDYNRDTSFIDNLERIYV